MVQLRSKGVTDSGEYAPPKGSQKKRQQIEAFKIFRVYADATRMNVVETLRKEEVHVVSNYRSADVYSNDPKGCVVKINSKIVGIVKPDGSVQTITSNPTFKGRARPVPGYQLPNTLIPKGDYKKDSAIAAFLDFHKDLGVLQPVSPLCNNSFPSTFNASTFHQQIFNLKPGEKIFGIDNCIRHLDFREPDQHHKSYFLMAAYAEAIEREKDSRGDFTDPGKHKQLFQFEDSLISQFFRFIKSSGIDATEISATIFAGGGIGGYGKGKYKDRDSVLSKRYKIPPDTGGLEALGKSISKDKVYPLKTLENININPEEGSLVGPRIEVAVRDFEIATIFFDYYRVKNGKLIPVDYVGGYAVGVERLKAAQEPNGNLFNTGILVAAKDSLAKHVPKMDTLPSPVFSPLIDSTIRQILSSTEAVLHISNIPREVINESEHRKAFVAGLKSTIYESMEKLGLNKDGFRSFAAEFGDAIRKGLPFPFNDVHPEAIQRVL